MSLLSDHEVDLDGGVICRGRGLQAIGAGMNLKAKEEVVKQEEECHQSPERF